jgi:hypothetical protein
MSSTIFKNRISSEKFKKHLHSLTEATTSKHLKSTAIKIAHFDFSQLTNSDFGFLTAQITHDFNQIVNQVDEHYSGDGILLEGSQDLNRTKDELSSLEEHIKQLSKKLPFLQAEAQAGDKNILAKGKTWKKVLLAISSIGLLESIANFKIFQMLGLSLISSISMSILSGLCLFWYGHSIPLRIQN